MALEYLYEFFYIYILYVYSMMVYAMHRSNVKGIDGSALLDWDDDLELMRFYVHSLGIVRRQDLSMLGIRSGTLRRYYRKEIMCYPKIQWARRTQDFVVKKSFVDEYKRTAE